MEIFSKKKIEGVLSLGLSTTIFKLYKHIWDTVCLAQVLHVYYA